MCVLAPGLYWRDLFMKTCCPTSGTRRQARDVMSSLLWSTQFSVQASTWRPTPAPTSSSPTSRGWWPTPPAPPTTTSPPLPWRPRWYTGCDGMKVRPGHGRTCMTASSVRGTTRGWSGSTGTVQCSTVQCSTVQYWRGIQDWRGRGQLPGGLLHHGGVCLDILSLFSMIVLLSIYMWVIWYMIRYTIIHMTNW